MNDNVQWPCLICRPVIGCRKAPTNPSKLNPSKLSRLSVHWLSRNLKNEYMVTQLPIIFYFFLFILVHWSCNLSWQCSLLYLSVLKILFEEKCSFNGALFSTQYTRIRFGYWMACIARKIWYLVEGIVSGMLFFITSASFSFCAISSFHALVLFSCPFCSIKGLKFSVGSIFVATLSAYTEPQVPAKEQLLKTKRFFGFSFLVSLSFPWFCLSVVKG